MQPRLAFLASALLLMPLPALAQVFDGKTTRLSGPTSVLVRGNKIAAIGAGAVPSAGTTVIDGGGRTLMPGPFSAFPSPAPGSPAAIADSDRS